MFKINESERLKLISDLTKENAPKVDPEITKKRKEIKKKMDVKTEQFNKTFYALNNRYPTQAEVDKSMQKFLSEEDQLIINNQPEETLIINIDEQLNLIKETNLKHEESKTESDSDDDNNDDNDNDEDNNDNEEPPK